MSSGAGAGDRALLRSTARRIAVQSAAVVALVVVALSALALVVALRQQHSQTDSLLRQATTSADDVVDPPASTWLAIRENGVTKTTPGIPRPLPALRDLDEVGRTGRTLTRDVGVDDREFRVRTQVRGDAVVQAAVDLAAQHSERSHLVAALVVVGGGGLVLAGAVGLVLGRRAVRPLAEALSLQRDFVADASHELRTPLTLLSTRAQLLARSLDGTDVPDQLKDDSHGVVRDTSRLVAVVDDLLLAADSGSAAEQVPLDLAVLCSELADSGRAYAQEHGITLRVDPADAAAVVCGNAVALRRALTALVDNALAHTPAGGTVLLTTRRGTDVCTVEVTDTGGGLDPSNADRIFDRFHSGSQRAGRRSYGLGLSLASGVATRHDGSLTVVSSGPGGTTFRLSLPAAGPSAGQGNSKN
jgi:two-component system OmpR family sensor kinase